MTQVKRRMSSASLFPSSLSKFSMMQKPLSYSVRVKQANETSSARSAFSLFYKNTYFLRKKQQKGGKITFRFDIKRKRGLRPRYSSDSWNGAGESVGWLSASICTASSIDSSHNCVCTDNRDFRRKRLNRPRNRRSRELRKAYASLLPGSVYGL